MADCEKTNQLSMFQKSGIYRFENSNAVFIDPVRVLNRSYTRFKVSPSAYYSRFFESGNSTADLFRVLKNSRKRKRKEKKPQPLNEREQIANQRHQEARVLLLKAHEALLGNVDLLETLRNLRSDEPSGGTSVEQSFVELGSVWQAPLYEITLNFHQDGNPNQVSQNGSGFFLKNLKVNSCLPFLFLFFCLVFSY